MARIDRIKPVFFDFAVQLVDSLRKIDPTVGVVRHQVPQQETECGELAFVDDVVQAADVDALVADADETQLRHGQLFAARAFGVCGKAVGQQHPMYPPQCGRRRCIGPGGRSIWPAPSRRGGQSLPSCIPGRRE